ncbi:alpha/beta hydrolase [Chlorogloeopsis sp. ULAP02]|uniref:alpha/beta fold hydrolase n=1 Tax=Chlorogloeopsis sp. ULAP02 TaxID=3107926 RepID=UPI003134771E
MSYKFTEKQVQVQEQSIFYLEGGIANNSTPILFIHGWAVGVDPYQEVLNNLCNRYHLIAPYLPGFGKSSGSVENWNYQNYAQVLIEFL